MTRFATALKDCAKGNRLRLPKEDSHRSKVLQTINSSLLLSSGSENAGHIDFDLNKISDQVSTAIATRTTDRLKLKDLRLFALTIWDPQISNGDNHPLLTSYLEVLNQRRPESAVRTLAREYLSAWPYGTSAWKSVSEFLQRYEPRRAAGFLALAQNNELFSGVAPVARIASACLADATNIFSVLENHGLQADLQSGKFAQAVFKKICDDCSQSGTTIAIEAVIEMSLTADKEEAFAEARAGFAKALLRPWGKYSLPDDLKIKIQSHLVQTLGDPRFGQSKWYGVDDRDIAVIRRWLAGEAIEKFLTIVDKTAEGHMWRFRRAFWQAYFDREIITEAWVVFGAQALRIAKRNKDSFTSDDLFSYGELNRAMADQSVLLLRIGEHTIAEWSHNGKVWIWRAGEKGAPALYQSEYYSDECRGAKFGKSHVSAANGKWQDEVAEEIFNITGLKVSRKNYMPKK